MTKYDKPEEIRVHCPMCEMNSAHKKDADFFYNDEHPLGMYACVICGKKILVGGFVIEGQGISKPNDVFKPGILRRVFSNKQRRLDRARHFFDAYYNYSTILTDSQNRRKDTNEPDKDEFSEAVLSLEEVIRREGIEYTKATMVWCNEGLGTGMYCARTGGSYHVLQNNPTKFGYESGRSFRRGIAKALGAEVIVDNMGE